VRKSQLVLGGLAFFLIIFSSPFVFGVLEEEVLPSDDAYHYDYFADGDHDGNYVEWWYFNLFAENIQVIFSYAIIDPENYTGLGMTAVGAVAYTPQGVVNESDSFPQDRFSASYDQADVRIEDNTIEVIDSDTYRIVGSIGDGRVQWDLIYTRQADSWFGGDREKVGLFPWEQMSWLVYMPGAYVSGEVQIDEEVYSVNKVLGYHDHNWGEWIPTNALWNWAQYFEPGLALEMGDFVNKPAGIVGIEYQGTRTVFVKEEYCLIHTQWAFDGETQKRVPIITWLYAENDTTRLIIRLETLETEGLRVEVPFPLPDIIIYEQTAHYEGWLWDKRSDGKWELLGSFRGNGFKEYTARKWKIRNQGED
jgi:hypothetical protein